MTFIEFKFENRLYATYIKMGFASLCKESTRYVVGMVRINTKSLIEVRTFLKEFYVFSGMT